MKIFGDRENFCIEYEMYSETYPDDKEIQERLDIYRTYGTMKFWLNGRNLFLYKGFGPDATYTSDLSMLVQAFCQCLIWYIQDDPFPCETKAIIGVNMLDEMKLVEGPDNDIQKYFDLDWEKVDSTLYRKIDKWNHNHGILTHRGGSFLPDICLRRIRRQVEISWNNNFSYKTGGSELRFEYTEGVEFVDVTIFKQIIVAFCLDVIKLYESQYPKAAKRDRDNLQKAIDFVV